MQNVLYNNIRHIMTYNCKSENLFCLRTSGTETPEVGRVCWKREVHIKAEKNSQTENEYQRSFLYSVK